MPEQRRTTPKSIRTRETIEEAARIAFSANGFERTTMRDIGARAGIDPSMIIRYFGSKEQLFARVAAPRLGLPALDPANPGVIGESLVRHFLEQWEGEKAGGGLPVLLRSAASNEEAAQRLRDLFRSEVFPAIARLGTPQSAPTRAGLVASQLLGLAMARYVLRLPPVVGMEKEMIIRTIGATIQRYATGDI